MGASDVTEEQFRNEMATLTLGSGAAAMVLARAELAPGAPRYKGGVTRAATQWNNLCRGNLDRMVTDTRMLLIEGLKLAQKTFVAAKLALGWVVEETRRVRHPPGQPGAHRRPSSRPSASIRRRC